MGPPRLRLILNPFCSKDIYIPRAVDDPGAYEPALPLHILTYIHHLQAGEIALATPAAALRLCLAYSRAHVTVFSPPLSLALTSACVPSGLQFSPRLETVACFGCRSGRFPTQLENDLEEWYLSAVSLGSSSFSELSTAPAVGLDFAYRLLALWWSGFDAERRNAPGPGLTL